MPAIVSIDASDDMKKAPRFGKRPKIVADMAEKYSEKPSLKIVAKKFGKKRKKARKVA